MHSTMSQKRTLLAQNVQKGKLRKLNNTSGASSTTMTPTRSAQSAGPIEAPGPSQTAKRQQAGAAASPKAPATAGSIKLPIKLVKRNGGGKGPKGPEGYLLAADGTYIAGMTQKKSERYLSILNLLASEIQNAGVVTIGAAREWIAQQS